MSLDLLDWRRAVASMYADVRSAIAQGRSDGVDRARTLERFRAARDALFRSHPESPLAPAARAAFTGLRYWPLREDLRFEVPLDPAPPGQLLATSEGGDPYPLNRIGRVRLPVGDLDVYWIDVYGGGVFLPFRDATSGDETYGGGRYLLDTIKGADLGGDSGRIVVDFNYAYHPSCVYASRWSCPLAPAENRLAVPVRAGERL